MQLCFFEDNGFKQFHPLTLTRPVDDLRIGILTIAQKWGQALKPDNASRLLRPELSGVFQTGEIDPSDSCLWINSRYLPGPALVKEIKQLGTGNCLQSGSTVIAAHVDGNTSAKWLREKKTDFNSLFVLESTDYRSILQLWDLFQMNGEEIRADLKLLQPAGSGDSDISQHAILENKDEIYIEDEVTIEAGAILNAKKGPVYIGKGATVMSGSIIYGPVAVCEGAKVNAGATIYGDTTIGPVCKVGGEVNNTIFHSYSNKGHDGFIGNSILGQWCNLGADTNTSNLKNNYSTIRITDWNTETEIETGQQFFGTVLGDHSKTAINTQLNTGTICGVNCNIFSGDFPPKFIPSFSWVGSNVIQTYKLDKALETMEAMMARRDVELSDAYKEMMRKLFKKSR